MKLRRPPTVLLPAFLVLAAWIGLGALAMRPVVANEPVAGEKHAAPGHGEEGAAGGHGGGEEHHGDHVSEKFMWAMFVVQAAGFIALLGVFWKFVRPGLMKSLDDRAARFRDAFDKAASTEAELKQMLADYENRLTHTGDESEKRLKKALADAESLVADMRQEAQTQADAIHGRIAGELTLERDRIMLEIRESVIGSAFAAAESDLSGKLLEDGRKQAALVEKALRGMETVTIPGF